MMGAPRTTERTTEDALVHVDPTQSPSLGTATTSRRRLAVGGIGVLALIIAVWTAAMHHWWGPYLVGGIVGLLSAIVAIRLSAALSLAIAPSMIAAIVPLLVSVGAGYPIIATAEATLAIIGLDASGWLLVLAALVAEFVLTLAGFWLGRAAGVLIRRTTLTESRP